MVQRQTNLEEWTASAEMPLPDHASETVAKLRVSLSQCRDHPGIDPLETRELLELDRHTAAQTYITALGMCLTRALGDAPLINAPGSAHYSFDEAWLLRLVERCMEKDAESMAFLISRRVPHQYRNAIAYLVNGLVWRLEVLNRTP